MASIWDNGEYLAEVGQKLGLSSEKVLQYINKGVLVLTTSGLIDTKTAKSRIKKHHETKWVDDDTAQANIALFNLTTRTGSAILSTESHYDYQSDGKLQMVRSLIVKGANQFQALTALIKQGSSYTEALKLYKSAMKSFQMTKGIDTAHEVAKIYARFEMLFAQAQESKDYQSTLIIQREFINFFNIKPPPPMEIPKSKEELEKESGIVRPLVYIPDNGRDPELTVINSEEPEGEN